MSLDEDTLRAVAADGQMDYGKWPAIIEPLLDRLNHIVYNDFITPKPYPTITQQPEPSSPEQIDSNLIADSTQPNTTTTTQAPTTPIRNLPPVPPFPNSSATSTSHIPDSLPPSQPNSSDPLIELPSILLQLLDSITQTLRSTFSDKPPHTIQRLAELTLEPKKYYKTLPAWLRAVDRVVSVSTSADVFPLSDAPPMVNGVNGDGIGGILWNNSTSENGRNGYDANGLGSDESLGGALLTPIPWLKNGVIGSEDTIDPNANEPEDNFDGSSSTDEVNLEDVTEIPSSESPGSNHPFVPEREDGAVTQGELIRMEQEAGVVPVSRAQQSTGVTMAGVEDEDDLELDEEFGDIHPHARGPNLIGSVDMGKVDGRDVQVSIGSPPQTDGTKEINVNDAQEVLSEARERAEGLQHENNSNTVTTNEEGFEMVVKPDMDEMAIDDIDENKIQQHEGKPEASPTADDEDIVLVDADGKMEEEEESSNVEGNHNIASESADS